MSIVGVIFSEFKTWRKLPKGCWFGGIRCRYVSPAYPIGYLVFMFENSLPKKTVSSPKLKTDFQVCEWEIIKNKKCYNDNFNILTP